MEQLPNLVSMLICLHVTEISDCPRREVQQLALRTLKSNRQASAWITPEERKKKRRKEVDSPDRWITYNQVLVADRKIRGLTRTC